MIKNFLILFLLCLSTFFLEASNLFTPRVDSEYLQNFTLENYQVSFPQYKDDDGYDFPLQSKENFISALRIYFTSCNKDKSLFYYQDKEAFIEGHVLGGVEFFQNNNSDNYLFPYYGFELKAIYQNLSMSGKWWKGHTTESNEYAYTSPLISSWVKSDDNQIYIDKIQGQVKYKFADLGYIALQRDKLEIGSNIGGSIILSDEKTNDYAFLASHINFGDFSLDFIHASLVTDSINTSGSSSIAKEDAPDKYLALHRFNWCPSPSLHLFVGEEVFYGNRNVDYNYFLPVGFWRITEHNQADRDNILIFAGADFSLQNTDFYTNIIFDELSKSKLFTSWWGNKYAVQTGVMQNNLYSKPEFSWNRIGIEFTAVRPWIYTHKYLYAKVSNDNQPLAFVDGSNLLKYTLENNVSFLQNRINWVINASYMRQGSIGNSYNINYSYEIDDSNKDKASWLDGGITDTYTIKQELNFNLLYSHRLKLSYEFSKIKKADSNSEFVISYQTRF